MELNSEYIEKIFDLKLKPVEATLLRLENILNQITSQNFDPRISSLEKSKVEYKIQYTNTVEVVNELIKRVEVIETKVIMINKDVETAISDRKVQVTNLTTDLTTFKKELNLVVLALRYPKWTIAIFIGLYLFAISDYFPMLLKRLF